MPDNGKLRQPPDSAWRAADEQQESSLTYTPIRPDEGSHRTGDGWHGWGPPPPTNAAHPEAASSSSSLPTTSTTTPSMTSTPVQSLENAPRDADPNADSPSVPSQPPAHRSKLMLSDDALHGHPPPPQQPTGLPRLPPDASPVSRPPAPLPSTQSSISAAPPPSSSTQHSSRLPHPVSASSLPNLSAPMSADSAHPIPDNAHINPTSSLTPDTFLPLLNCPLCDPPSILVSPVTLRCGHTICLQHLTDPTESSQDSSSFVSSFLSSVASSSKRKLPLPSCPLPTCMSTVYASDNVTAEQLPRHPQSRVNYLPPPPAPYTPLDSEPEQDPSPLRVDVTVNKILSLIVLSRPLFLDSSSTSPVRPFSEDDDRTDSESEDNDSGVVDEDAPDLAHSSDLDRLSFASVPDFPLPNRAYRRPRSSSPVSSRRSRKRPRRTRDEGSRRPANHSEPPLSASAKLEKELYAELTCHICFGLMWQPVTTPCQHTFCSKCLHRSLDHSNACPLCRQQLPGYAYFQENVGRSSTTTETGACNKLVLAIILKAFPEAYRSRGDAIEEEEREGRLDTPVFVCQLCYPGMPMFLNFYEPRYRLMLRRCLSTPSPCFGAIPPPRTSPTVTSPSSSQGLPEYGTMLEIRNVQMLPDGQIRVETWGTSRFRILEQGNLDGYSVARIERVDDLEDEDELFDGLSSSAVAAPAISQIPSAPTANGTHAGPPPSSTSRSSVPTAASTPSSHRTIRELMDVCHAFLDQLREGTPWVVQHLDESYVPMPEDPAQFSFWMGLLLPIDEHEKAKLLPIRSIRLRLRLVVHWIDQLNSHWFFSYAPASRSQVVLRWLRYLLISCYIYMFFRPRPFFILQDHRRWRHRFALPGLRTRGGVRVNLLVLTGYVVLVWAIVKAQRRLGEA